MKTRAIGGLLVVLVAVATSLGGIGNLAAAGRSPAGPDTGPGSSAWSAVIIATPTLAVSWSGLTEKFWKVVRVAKFIGLALCNLLLAWWVKLDLDRRAGDDGWPEGWWVWVVVALLGGFVGAGVYALVRLGDHRG